MTIQLQCPQCAKQYRVGDDLAGKKVRCKCGQALAVPAATEPELQPLGDDIFAAEEDALGLNAAASPLGTLPKSAAAARTAAQPKKAKKKKKPAQRPDDGTFSRQALIGMGIGGGGLLLVVVIALAAFLYLSTRPGFGSPQDAFAAYQKALDERDWKEQYQVFSPQAQEKALQGLVSLALTNHERSKFVKACFEKHGVVKILEDEIIAAIKEPASDKRAARIQVYQQQLDAQVANRANFFRDLNQAVMDTQEQDVGNAVLKVFHRRVREEIRRAQVGATLAEVSVTGNNASGVMHMVLGEDNIELNLPVQFTQHGGAWYLESVDVSALAMML